MMIGMDGDGCRSTKGVCWVQKSNRAPGLGRASVQGQRQRSCHASRCSLHSSHVHLLLTSYAALPTLPGGPAPSGLLTMRQTAAKWRRAARVTATWKHSWYPNTWGTGSGQRAA